MSTNDYETIDVDVDGAVGRVTLNRPDKLNPLSTATLLELADAFTTLDEADGLKVVIVSGRGRAFSAGADLSLFGSPEANQGADEAKALGFLNRVVAPGEVDAEVESLAATLTGKSTLTLQATKRNVNAVLESMSGAVRNWNDADSLVVALHDDESRAVAARYLERVRKG